MAAAKQAALPLWSQRLSIELDESDRRARALADGLSLEQLNWRPQPGSWSVGQCLKHLATTNEIYMPQLTDALRDATPSQVQEIVPGWFGRWFIRKFVEPSSKTTRVKSPKKIDPGEEVDSDVLAAFLRSNQLVRDFVAKSSANDVNRIRFKNPFVPLIRFTVGTGLEIISKHEQRHLLQAERVRHNPNFGR